MTRAYIGKKTGMAFPTQGHGVNSHGAVVRLFRKPTRADRKARVAALKAKQNQTGE